jgi:hypothetical protein
MPRARILGIIACVISAALLAVFGYYAYIYNDAYSISNFQKIAAETYYAVAVPVGMVTIGILSTGFWVGMTILTIKVAPPMPEIVEKKDNSKFKAFLLCLVTAALAVLFIYGVVQQYYLAIAIPATVIALVLLGMVFWVGVAIITARSTLYKEK